jgi:hypothetical protein
MYQEYNDSGNEWTLWHNIQLCLRWWLPLHPKSLMDGVKKDLSQFTKGMESEQQRFWNYMFSLQALNYPD